MSEFRFMTESMTNRAEDWDLELEQCKIRTYINCKKKIIHKLVHIIWGMQYYYNY
jgi:hypothetical protein